MSEAKQCDFCKNFYVPEGYAEGEIVFFMAGIEQTEYMDQAIIRKDVCPTCRKILNDKIQELKKPKIKKKKTYNISIESRKRMSDRMSRRNNLTRSLMKENPGIKFKKAMVEAGKIETDKENKENSRKFKKIKISTSSNYQIIPTKNKRQKKHKKQETR